MLDGSTYIPSMYQTQLNEITAKRAGIPYDVVQSYRKKRWEFFINTWTDRHKGDEYYELTFKSPTMTEFSTIDGGKEGMYFKDLTEKSMMNHLYRHSAKKWREHLLQYSSKIESSIDEGILNYLKDNEFPRIKKIYDEAMEVNVSVCPKCKDKPKKVKINISIE